MRFIGECLQNSRVRGLVKERVGVGTLGGIEPDGVGLGVVLASQRTTLGSLEVFDELDVDPGQGTLERLCEPFLGPVRRVVPLVGGVDLSPLALLLVLQLLGMLLAGLQTGWLY